METLIYKWDSMQNKSKDHCNVKFIVIFLSVLLTCVGSVHLPLEIFDYGIAEKPMKRQSSVCHNYAIGEFVSNPDNCRLFYFCTENGEAILAACPPSMLFNPISKLCDKPANVECRNFGSSTTLSDAITAAPGNPFDENASNDLLADEITEANRYCISLQTNQDPNRMIYIGSSIDCRQYYICYHGQAISQECSINLHWNAVAGKCDLPEKASCAHSNHNHNNVNSGVNSVDNVGSNTDNNFSWSSNNAIICPNYGKQIFPHMGRCDFFIYCVQGQATLQQCPFYHHFDIISKSCKPRSLSLCVRDINIQANDAI